MRVLGNAETGVELVGNLDEAAVINSIPPASDGFVVKGMFFTRFAEIMGPDLAGVALEAPPRRGFGAFTDYSQRDYQRLLFAVAHKLHKGRGTREAMRRIAADDLHVFAKSMLGAVTLKLVGDAKSALLRVPTVYRQISRHLKSITGEEKGNEIVIEFQPFVGVWEYQLGQFEGIANHFGVTRVRTVVEEPNKGDVRYRITLG